MKKTTAITILACTIGLLSSTPVLAIKCGTRSPTQAEKQATQKKAKARLTTRKVTHPFSVNPPVVIPIVFHIISSSFGKGDVPDSVINTQIKVLNDAYKGTGFQFSMASIDRVSNNAWFNKCFTDETTEGDMKAELSVDPTYNINIYTCRAGEDDLGISTLPEDYDENDVMHGVLLHYETLPNVLKKDPYNKGDTAVHEIGHYLGLYHTFDDDDDGDGKQSCDKDNDLVDDTPIEKTNNMNTCPTARDTCPNSIGKDPIANYMDYSPDACLTMFSVGQIVRMQEQVQAFRPSLLEN